jgi:hypothetical protein
LLYWFNCSFISYYDRIRYPHSGFHCLLHYGHFDAAWEFDYDHQIRNHLTSSNRQQIFQAACRCGQLDIAQQMYAAGGVDIHADEEVAFYVSCKYGHLSVCQWLCSMGKIKKISAHNHIVFIYIEIFIFVCAEIFSLVKSYLN